MTNDKLLLFRLHPTAEGLSEEAAREIANACELRKLESGEYLHRANSPLNHIHLIIHGRIRQTMVDVRGAVQMQRFIGAGAQFGALAAALGEPSPLNAIAEEPTTVLQLDYPTAMELTHKHNEFRTNFSKLIALSVKRVLLKDRVQKKPILIGIFHQADSSRALTAKLIQRLQKLGERPCLFTDQESVNGLKDVPVRSLIENGSLISEQEIRHQMQTWSDATRVFVDVDTQLAPSKAADLVEVCEKVFWCISPRNWEASLARLQAIEQRASGWREKINVVWLLNDGSPWAPYAPDLACLVKRCFTVSLDKPRPEVGGALNDGVDRILHQLAGVRVGIALGGGAARGMAHLGVLKALEQNGVVIDMIAGTSAGAMTGIIHASGMSPDYAIQRFIHDLTPSWIFRHLPRGGHWYLLTKYRLGKFDPMLRKYLKDVRLEQLPIPVSAVAVDLISGNPIVRDTGDAVHAITESINLPVLSTPINRNGMALVDGGIVNNVPADVLVAKGCNVVIAVSVTAKMEPHFARNSCHTPTDKMHSASTLQTILRTFLVQSVNMNSVGISPADIVIEPDVTEFDITEFTRTDEIAAVGEAAALQAIPDIQQTIAQFIQQHQSSRP